MSHSSSASREPAKPPSPPIRAASSSATTNIAGATTASSTSKAAATPSASTSLAQSEPEIYDAIRFGTVLENVVYDEDTRAVDFDSATHHRKHPRRLSRSNTSPTPKCPASAAIRRNIIFLTCDAFGVIPPVSRLTPEQAMYHFISGYTARVAGTEDGRERTAGRLFRLLSAPRS